MAMAVGSCTDDETFSTSPADLLTFSKDTISLDTIFSQVPSSTRTFWVYNNSKDALRCTNIKLGKGNQTGFRVNVNGIYLGDAQGFQIFDEEIRKGDSIRVFVEITTPLNGKDCPDLVSDNLIFTLESGLQQKVCLNAWSWDADLLRNPVIRHDTAFSSARPTVVYGTLTVNKDATLTLPAGKTLYMNSDGKIDVHGRLMCQGQKGQEVTIRGNRLDHMFDYLPYDGVSGQWQGIILHSDSYDNSICYTDIHSAYNAIVCDSADVSRTKLTISNSTIHNNKGYGLHADNCKIIAENTLFSNSLNDCLSIVGGHAVINNCTMAQFYPFDARRGAALYLKNYKEDMQREMSHLSVRNSVITGYSDDCLVFDLNDTIKTNLAIENCLLRTDSTKIFGDVVTGCIYEDVTDTTVAGWKNFMKVDIEKLRYDFHLAPTSKAIGIASRETSLPVDRDGTTRKQNPDAGCFEWLKQE